ncbi:MAG: hypothetical protein WCZ18_06070 [Ottowia sp.]|nr:hypothetical protein [Ottowia sp.]
MNQKSRVSRVNCIRIRIEENVIQTKKPPRGSLPVVAQAGTGRAGTASSLSCEPFDLR